MAVALIIDDDPIFHHLIGHLIDKHNLFDSYTPYTDPQIALIDLINAYYFNQSLPDLIMLDLNMPMVDGWEFLSTFDNLRALISKEIPIYVVTSSVDPLDKERAGRFSSVKGFFVKPITTEVLRLIAADVSE